MSPHRFLPVTPRRCRGFTLIEVLSASVLSAILAGAFAAALASAVSLRQRVDTLVDSRRPSDRAIEIIRKDLELTLPPGDSLVGDFLGESAGGFGAERSTLEFFTASGRLTEDAPWPRVQRILYAIDKNPDTGGDALYRSVTRNLLALTEEDPEDHVLLDGVDSLNIEYYDGESWQETWDSSLQDPPLPKAVLFVATSSEDADGFERQSLRLYVPLLVEARPAEEEDAEGQAGGGSPEGGNAQPEGPTEGPPPGGAGGGGR